MESSCGLARPQPEVHNVNGGKSQHVRSSNQVLTLLSYAAMVFTAVCWRCCRCPRIKGGR